MDEKLNDEFKMWLGRIAVEWAIPEDKVPSYLGTGEVNDRLKCFPALGQAVTQNPVKMADVETAGKACWALGERFDAIRFGEFVSNPQSAIAIADLISEFPVDDDAAANRIESFMRACDSLGYRDRKSNNLNASSVGLLTSTILTTAFPKRFVDFRQTRGKTCRAELDYPLFQDGVSSYGQMIVESGKFAAAICHTWTRLGILGLPANHFGQSLASVGTPTPSMAKRPKGVTVYRYEEDKDFDEGEIVLRAHLIRERNALLVKKAKDAWRASDPLLHCEVCQFSFLEAYGDEYIEAHHTKPLATLKAGAKTRIDDLARVWANCHRMLHLSGCISIEELRGRLRKASVQAV